MVGSVKDRDYYYDNAKFILMFLVVLGHCLEPYIKYNTLLGGIFGFIYMFHMPAFIFVSGYFTKKDIDKKVITKIVLDYLVMFVLVQLLFVTFTKMIGLHQYRLITTQPAYIYWYLFAMFVWSIVLKVAILIFEQLGLKVEYLIGLSFILGLIVGYFDSVSWEYSLSRIIVFFPFFVFGYYFRAKNKKISEVIHNKTVSTGIMVLGIISAFLYDNIFNFDLLSCANSYNSIGLGKYGMIYRVVVYITQILMMFSFFSFIPKSKNYFTTIGSKTLNIYIFHGFIIKLLVALSYYRSISLIKIWLLPIFAILIVLTFGKIPINVQLSKFKIPIVYKNESIN